jgi:phospholipid/cholesterol/gamma-HCH transport system substrate-binding protein
MPFEQKTTWARLRVGVLAIAALLILGVLVYLLSGTQGFFRSHSTLYTYLQEAAGVTNGGPVRLNGFVVGKVKDVELTGSNQPGRIIRVSLDVYSEYLPQIPVDSEAELAQLNLLGAKYVNISKGKSSQLIANGAELKSSSAPEIQEFMKQGSSMIGQMQDILGRVNAMLTDIQTGKGTIGKFIYDPTMYNNVLSIMAQIQKLTETLNSNRGIGKFINGDELSDDIHGVVTRIDKLMDGIEQGQGTLGKFVKDPALFDDSRAAIADLRKSMDQIHTLLADVNAGKGDVGKLFKSEELHEELKASMERIDKILDKVNEGNGTLGQLLNNPSLYENLDGTTRQLEGLMKDFRANPKKFLTIKLVLF